MMQDKPFLSVVIPTYNRADLIGDTIRSLQKQSYDNYEIIVVDDGSTDNTEEVVNSVADARTRFLRKGNAERAAARNFGAREAKGDYVNFFDSDDLALPNHLEEAARLIQGKNRPEWFHVGYCWATPDRQVFRNVNNFTGDTLNAVLPLGNPLSCNSVFVRKDIILAHSFNEDRDLSASEDYELWLRLGARYPLYYSNTITSLIIDHEARSVRKINFDKLIKRFDILLAAIQSDATVMKVYGKQYSYMKMDSNSYIAVHLADRPAYKLKSIQYLATAMVNDPRLVTTKRFFATIKNLIIRW
jgi:glycosyltransferase involved in cell wall biosynthesis